MPIKSNDIAACHTFPKRENGKANIIVRFINRKSKVGLLKEAKKLSGTGVYINEHLTKKNADIARQAHILRRQNKIHATWTRNCKVMIRQIGSSESAKVIWIKELKDLDPYRN